jgi:hypothetical protein
LSLHSSTPTPCWSCYSVQLCWTLIYLSARREWSCRYFALEYWLMWWVSCGEAQAVMHGHHHSAGIGICEPHQSWRYPVCLANYIEAEMRTLQLLSIVQFWMNVIF